MATSSSHRSTNSTDNSYNINQQFELHRAVEQRKNEKEALELLASDNGVFRMEGEHPVRFRMEDLELNTSKRIGRGAFTEEVIKGTYKPKELSMAIKKIRIVTNAQRRTGKEQDSVIREANYVRKAAHANVVVLYGFIVEQLTCYLCMELMDANLDEVRRVAHKVDGMGEEPFSPRKIEQFLGCVTVAVVDALFHLRNEVRMIHRDLKPNNIMINSKGEVKMCDFGVSKKLETGISSTRANTSGAGCLIYMAPERFDPTSGYGSKSEVWSFGMALYELATGSHPFKDIKQDFLIAERIKDNDPPSISKESGFGLNFRTFLSACLFKSERDRAGINPTNEKNCLQSKKFYTIHAGREKDSESMESRGGNVRSVLERVRPYVDRIREHLEPK